MTVTPDAVEAAAKADWEGEPTHCPWEELHPAIQESVRARVRPVLAAAAPLIAKQTLLDAADAWADVARAHGTPAELFLVHRAATLTPKEN